MARPRRDSNASQTSSMPGGEQELGSMYDYLAKIILIGPSGSGKSCLLHRFIKDEWRILTSQTIGVEFASKILRLGTPPNHTRIKLQLWDTAGTERFRSVSRSYYRGAAGALLVYDVTSRASFGGLPTFMHDARALAGEGLVMALVGSKVDAAEGNPTESDSTYPTRGAGPTDRQRPSNGKTTRNGPTPADALIAVESSPATAASPQPGSMTAGTDSANALHPDAAHAAAADGSAASLASAETAAAPSSQTSGAATGFGARQTSTVAPQGRAITAAEAARWASAYQIPVAVEVSALDGSGVNEVFAKLARTILTKIELGEIDPDDPASGIQYGDGAWREDGGSVRSVRSGASADGSLRRRKGKRGAMTSLRDWEDMFRLDSVSRRRRRGCC